MLGVHVESPPVYVVRNTFVELVDDCAEPHLEEVSVPHCRRRRGSSYFRCSSEPLAAGGRLSGGRTSACQDKPVLDGSSTDDEGSDGGCSTPELSPASSRTSSPSPGSHSPVYANMSRVPEPEQAAVAAMQGFNAGLWAAMAMNEQTQQMPVQNVTYQPRRVRMGQVPFFEARKPPFAFPTQFAQPRAVMRDLSPDGNMSSNSSDAGIVVTKSVDESKQPCHVIWCDHRAFKETSGALKEQLESGCRSTVKTHKTAENCIRLFRKKQRAQGRPPCVLLVSWANAPALLSYLTEAQHVSAKVVVLCDARSCRKNESADQLMSQFPFIEKIATTWEEAVESACSAAAAFR